MICRNDLITPIITGFHAAQDRCIRDKRWSYVARPEDEPDELYDMQSDWRETKNLIDDHHEEAQRLSAAFGQYFRRGPVHVVKGIQGRYEMGSGSVR